MGGCGMLFRLFIIMFVVYALKRAVKNAVGTGATSNNTFSARRQNIQRQSGMRTAVQNRTTGFVQTSKPSANRQVYSNKKPRAKDQVFTSLDPLHRLKERVYSRKANSSFFNSDFDDYSAVRARGPKTDYVSGYDRNYADGSSARRYNLGMQYSHTYDGHEPWDDCLPKEKDPWDKDFYTN